MSTAWYLNNPHTETLRVRLLREMDAMDVRLEGELSVSAKEGLALTIV